jgi:cytochrome c-type biogenesis protein CcmH
MKRAILFALALSGAAWAVQPDEMLPDPAMEARARAISRDLRCLVCQNQSIDDSDAELAKDLRVLLRQRLVAGDSDGQARQYLVDRYGDYVLLKPPVKSSTYLLWGGPALLLIGGVLAALAVFRRKSVKPPAALTADEQDRLSKLL